MKNPAPPETQMSQISPSGNKSITELMQQFQPIFSSTAIAENTLRIKDDFVDSILWGAELAPGIQILDWKATIHRGHHVIRFEHNPEDNEPVWTLLLSDYPFVSPMHKIEDEHSPQRNTNISYLYNLECPLHLTLRPSPQAHVVLIRIRQDAWEHIFSHPPSFLANFIAARDPLFYGFPLTYQQRSTLVSQFKQRPVIATERWSCLANILHLANDTFTQLEQRDAHSSKHQILRPVDSKRITLAHDLLLADFQAAPNLEEICRKAGLGRDKLRRLFRQVYGLSPYEYFQQRRMEEARRLLESGTWSVMNTGHQVGFSHMGHFAQAFKKYQGCLPSEVMKRG